jgi:hypothetical protein
MEFFRKISRLCPLIVVAAFCLLSVLATSARAIDGPTIVTFEELDKGATSHFVDNAPKATLEHGVASFTPGDMLISTNPLAMEGRIVGKIRIVCTATGTGNTKNFSGPGFNCAGIAKVPGGSLVLIAELSESPVEGAITGGTGIYAGATGTFVSRRGRGASTTTVTLLQ